MKKTILLLVLVGVFTHTNAFEIIQNASFEKWSSASYDELTNYPFSSNLDAFFDKHPFSLEKTTEAYQGLYAVKLSSQQSQYSSMGYFLNTDPGEGDMDKWKNGILYNQIPTGIRGYYKYNVENTDSAMILVSFRKAGASLRNYIFRVGGIKTNYTLFEFPLIPALTEIPDSVIFGATSSDFMKYDGGVAGSVLFLDNVSFTGVISQPALFNGDFENWTTKQSPYALDDWSKNSWQQRGFARTENAKDGNYALELTSYATEDDDIYRNQPAILTNNYWDNSCGCLKGGFPFSTMKDTLTFWYKYAPSGDDKAEVSIRFSNSIYSFDGRNLELDASETYKYIEIPFQLNQASELMFIDFISSKWDNENISYVGSKLTLDKLELKSQKVNSGLNIQNSASSLDILPTSTNGLYKIKNMPQTAFSVEVYSSTGARITFNQNAFDEINLSNQPTGMYIVRLVMGNKSVNKRIIKN